jgi:hypothetical protein
MQIVGRALLTALGLLLAVSGTASARGGRTLREATAAARKASMTRERIAREGWSITAPHKEGIQVVSFSGQHRITRFFRVERPGQVKRLPTVFADRRLE